MNAERIAIYGKGFPNGFAQFTAQNIDVVKEKNAFPSRKKSRFTRPAKEGERALRLAIDPNGAVHVAGDVIIGLSIASKLYPGLATPADYRVVAAKDRFAVSYGDGNIKWYQYIVVAPVTAGDAECVEQCKRLADDRRRQTMDWAMNS